MTPPPSGAGVCAALSAAEGLLGWKHAVQGKRLPLQLLAPRYSEATASAWGPLLDLGSTACPRSFCPLIPGCIALSGYQMRRLQTGSQA